MSFPKQMHWQIAGVILIWWYLPAPAVAKCNPQWCGSKNVSYPFWIDNPSCRHPGFQIKCMEKENRNSSRELGIFLGVVVNGTETELEILEISYDGSLVINSTSLKAMSWNKTDDASVKFELPADGPFTIYSSNKFVVIGCRSKGSFTLNGQVGKCESACLNTHDPIYCNDYGCCESGIPGNARVINFTGGGISYNGFPECGYSTILEPGTWDSPKGQGGFAKGHYGIRLQWSISDGNCSTAKGTANYSCAGEAQCLNQTKNGHVCKCPAGYEGSGYSNGTGCTDVDECSQGDLNQCVNASQGGICHNFPGYYNCSCAREYTGNGFQNGTRCQSRSSNNSLKSAVIGNPAVCLL